MIACVIGNGPSRLEFDLLTIKSGMTTYGCNALHRDFMPDYLISMDIAMVKEILESDVHLLTKFYTQHDNQIDEIAKTEPINFFWGFKETNDSGNSALRLALMQDNDIVYMIGFDYNNGSQLPNVYSGTPNYCSSHMYPAANMKVSEWRQRLNKILKDYPNKKIIRVNGHSIFDIQHQNYCEITPEQFKEIYESTT